MNSKRPTPIAEIAARRKDDGLGGSTIHITGVTPDAQAWIVKELPVYGKLRSYSAVEHMLDVFQNYNGDDVLAFILSYNEA
jgi:hypothetical protein